MTEEAPVETGQAEEAPVTEGQANWYDEAPDEVKGYIQNKGWDDPIEAVTSYQELEKFRGASEDQLLKLPKDFDEEGALDPIYDKLGRPESPDKYELELPTDMPIDDNRVNRFKEVAHKAGLNNKQIEALAKADMEYSAEFMNSLKEETAKQQQLELSQLEKEWGSAFEERAELGRRFVRSNIPEGMDKGETLNKIEEAIGTAAMLKLFANASEKGMSKEDRVPDSSGDRPYGYTREQATADKRALMSELSADPDRLANYNKGVGPDIDKMKNLNKIIAS